MLYKILQIIGYYPGAYKDFEIDFVKNDHLFAVKTEDNIVKTMIHVPASLSNTDTKELLYADKYQILIGSIRIGEHDIIK